MPEMNEANIQLSWIQRGAFAHAEPIAPLPDAFFRAREPVLCLAPGNRLKAWGSHAIDAQPWTINNVAIEFVRRGQSQFVAFLDDETLRRLRNFDPLEDAEPAPRASRSRIDRAQELYAAWRRNRSKPWYEEDEETRGWVMTYRGYRYSQAWRTIYRSGIEAALKKSLDKAVERADEFAEYRDWFASLELEDRAKGFEGGISNLERRHMVAVEEIEQMMALYDFAIGEDRALVDTWADMIAEQLERDHNLERVTKYAEDGCLWFARPSGQEHYLRLCGLAQPMGDDRYGVSVLQDWTRGCAVRDVHGYAERLFAKPWLDIGWLAGRRTIGAHHPVSGWDHSGFHKPPVSLTFTEEERARAPASVIKAFNMCRYTSW